MTAPLVLSLFPGIGLFDRAFEEEGFCVVRGPDLLWGGDVRRFHPPAGRFDGVIGGPPCQAFSALRYLVRATGKEPRHGNMIPEYERVVSEARPSWFVMENVPQAPKPVVDGYAVTHFVLCPTWLGEAQKRKRRFSFGIAGAEGVDLRGFIEYAALELPDTARAVRGRNDGNPQPWEIANGRATTKYRRSWAERCELQGLPSTFLAGAPFTTACKDEVLGNGVPLPMGRAIARAVRKALA